jgi:Bacterial extracellular solute-binding protein, family 7
MRLHHFMGGVSPGHREFLQPWAKKVESGSGGRIKIDVFPSMQLGGAPPQLFDQARDGVVDLVLDPAGLHDQPPPHHRGLRVALHRRSARDDQLADAAGILDQASRERVRRDPSDLLLGPCGGLIHSNRAVTRLEDMKSLKLRFPTRLAGEGLRALGATAIGMPVPPCAGCGGGGEEELVAGSARTSETQPIESAKLESVRAPGCDCPKRKRQEPIRRSVLGRRARPRAGRRHHCRTRPHRAGHFRPGSARRRRHRASDADRDSGRSPAPTMRPRRRVEVAAITFSEASRATEPTSLFKFARSSSGMSRSQGIQLEDHPAGDRCNRANTQ